MSSQVYETCRTLPTQVSPACGNVICCSKEHQQLDGENHLESCASFKVSINDTLGRHIVATKNIKEGEVIMKKNPLILGPKMISPPLCLGCHKRLDGSNYHLCTQCKWPLCSKDCETSKIHQDECRIFRKFNYNPEIDLQNPKQSLYAFILPLRALILKQNEREKFDMILDFQSHLEEHIHTPVYQILRRSLVNLLIVRLKIDTTEEEILKLCSIFDTNTFEIRDKKGSINIRALYPMVSYLSHNCKHNTKHVFNGEGHELTLIATMPIAKNELITATYTQTLWGTLTRRAHLKESKHFDCICDRCRDPTEFGTYAGSFYCPECNDEQSKMISTSPIDQDAPWRCENCQNEMGASEVMCINNFLKQGIMEMDKTDAKYLEEFLESYKHLLHPKNYHVLQIKYALFQMYSGVDFTDELLDRKIQICQELLEIADTLEPGYSRFRGCVLYELHLGLLEKNDRTLKKQKISDSDYQKNFKAAEKMFDESKKILKSEPDYQDLIQSKVNRNRNRCEN